MRYLIKFYNIFLILIGLNSNVMAQSYIISGTVTSEESGETVIGASVYTQDFVYGTFSDENGKFTLNINGQNQSLIISYIGFVSDTIILKNIDEVINIKLQIDALPEVIVKSKISLENHIGKANISAKELKRIPSLLGEVDIIKSLTMLPGISGSIEGSSGLLVRGGKSDQNLVLLDGIPIYNPAHLFGFISVFNPATIKHVELTKSGFPSQYGGRLSSVLNVNLKDGNVKKRHTELTFGLLNSSFLTEGPIIKNKLSYVLAGRSTNVGILLSPLWFAYKANKIDSYFSYWVTDLNVKLNYKINPKQNLQLSYYKGIDKFSILTKEEGLSESKSTTKWGNHGISLMYNYVIRPNVIFDVGVQLNQYGYHQLSFFSNPEINQITDYRNISRVNDLSIKSKLDIIHNPSHISRLGIEYNSKQFTPYNLKNTLKDTLENIKFNYFFEQETSSKNLSVFYDHIYQPTKPIKIIAGLRASHYVNNSYKFNSIEPRLTINYYPNNKSVVKFAYDLMTQPIHNLSNSGVGIPNEIWIPATTNIPAGTSHQLSLGYSLNLPKFKSFISIEGYYKTAKDATRLKYFTPIFLNTYTDWENQFSTSGKRKAFGFEFLYKKDVGKLTGWFGYTFAKSKVLFGDVNNNNWFPSDFSKTHELEITANYQTSKKWSFGANFVFQSGRPITLPDAYTSDIFGNYSFVISSINKYRTENYHRLDISATKSYLTKRKNEASWTFSVYNVYAHNNALYYNTTIINNSYENFGPVKFELEKVSLLNIIPSISYSVKF